MNLIAPDTFDKKEREIKDLMFKTSEEIEGEESKEGKDFLTLDSENLSQIVMTLFRKAQVERDYGKMYAQLCQNLIQEELHKIGEQKVTKKTIAKSVFRKTLLQSCRASFDKLFMSEEEFNAKEDEEQLKLKDKLMNNIKFIAYLFKFNLIQEGTILSIFKDLFEGRDEKKEPVSDRAIEGAIVLINKIGVEADRQIASCAEGIKKAEEAIK